MQTQTSPIRSIAYQAFILTVLICSLILDSQTVFAESIAIAATTDITSNTKSTGGMVDRSHDIKEKQKKDESNNNRAARSASRHTTSNSWVHNVDFEYLLDNDGDGFFHRFRVTFDADTLLVSDRIYAKLYLDNQDEERLYYVTENFTIIGEALSDSYEVTTSLTEGYDSDIYNLRVAIYDAYTHELLDSVNAYDDDDLYGRYLEQVDLDSFQSTIFTIQELTIALSSDTDNDGFFPELDITIDADMSFGTEWVALNVYIVDPSGIETLLYQNNDWFISGYQSSDKDITNVLLESGYRSDYYHIRAKLYDADNGLLLATADTTRSSGLAIESEDYDDSFDSSNSHIDDNHYGAESDGHGGALSWFGLLAVAGLMGLRKAYR
ncbi:hypothetical protein A9Q81_27205 [Gammaproteobacteria bacterium 42_54_T18]|nr:hypothetical protein A9Q81_27205 [Gammaproteobacteria bacterium 42_54_T18]